MFYNRIEKLCKQKGISITSFVESGLKMSRSNVTKWREGKVPKSDTVQKIADYFGVTTDYLLTGESNIVNFPNSADKTIKIPELGYVRAGTPINAVEEILDYVEIPAEWARSGEYFALRVKGNSMEPRICGGDTVIVKKQSDVDSGDIGIVLVNGEDATIKKVMKNSHGITLIPFNPVYEPMMFTNKEIASKPVSIVGKVVELRAKF